MMVQWEEHEQTEVDFHPHYHHQKLELESCQGSWKKRKKKAQSRITGQIWHTRQVSLASQEIFIKFNISSNDYIMRMWLNKSITYYIFRISNKYALFTFRLQCFPFFIWNVSPCFTTKHTKVTYIWFSFTPCFFRCDTL